MTKVPQNFKTTKNTPNFLIDQNNLETSKMTKNTLKFVKWPKIPPKPLNWPKYPQKNIKWFLKKKPKIAKMTKMPLNPPPEWEKKLKPLNDQNTPKPIKWIPPKSQDVWWMPSKKKKSYIIT